MQHLQLRSAEVQSVLKRNNSFLKKGSKQKGLGLKIQVLFAV